MDFFSAAALSVARAAGLETQRVREILESPPEEGLGDVALPCFKLSRELKKAPQAIAAELADKIERPDDFSGVRATGGYLNFFLDRPRFIQTVLREIEQAGETYGSSAMGAGRTVCVDYSSINIAKPFHIGHLLTTAIGNALCRIYGFLGYRAVGINHLGDWGTQFGKLIAAYKRWGDRDEIEKEGVNAMLALYVRFHDEADRDATLEDEARAWFKKIEDADEEAVSYFEWLKERTLKEVRRVYDILGVRFESYAGESFYNDKMQPVIDELRKKGLLRESEGAFVVDVGDDLPPCIVLKSDGATLYSTRDLAAAVYRKQTYDFYKCLYVVAYQQSLHFKQCFRVLARMGHAWAKDLVHVPFGMVSLEDGTLSTRRGKVVFLEEVLRKAVEKTRAIIEEKNPDIADKEQTAEAVGVGAVVFQALYNNRIKDMVFSWERALNFDGETGPYAQYTHVRCTSVLKKAGDGFDKAASDFSGLDNPQAFAVVKLLNAFPQTTVDAAEKYEPSLVTRYIIALSQAFNKYYFDCRIIDADREKTNARLMMTRSVQRVLKTALNLIGIQAPERM